MKQLSPLLSTDFYKTIHHKAYKEGLTELVSYWTPRMSRLEGMNEVVMFGLQAFIKEHLIERFNKDFFGRPLQEVIDEYVRTVTHTMGSEYADTTHIEELHKMGYLPIQISAVKEGIKVPVKVPMIEIKSTHLDFAWLVNYLETYMSCNIWQPMTSATIADHFMKIVSKYYEETGCTRDVVTACGDFSMRGFSSEESACKSSAGHLLSFTSTATIPVINWLEQYYGADITKETVGRGTPSTEHSVMCTYGQEELECYRHLITEQFPKGTISIVSDTYNYWNVLTNILPKLKNEIMTRDGKVVIRGDSGDPVDIICGESVKTYKNESDFVFDANINWYYERNRIVKVEDKYYCAVDGKEMGVRKDFIRGKRYGMKYDEDLVWVECEPTNEVKGTVEILWEIFGGHINEKGYKVLDAHIGTIYGDSITTGRCEEICKRLKEKGFATENVTFGIGSHTYQMNTRDTFGFALKATHSVINGEEVKIFKDPKTDTGNFKKSQRGLCFVYYNKEGLITYTDDLTYNEWADMNQLYENLLEPVFKNGELLKDYTLAEVRETLRTQQIN